MKIQVQISWVGNQLRKRMTMKTKIMTKPLMIPINCCQLQSSQPAKCHQEKHLSAANRLWHKSQFLKVPLFKSPTFLKVFLIKVPLSADCKTDNEKSPTPPPTLLLDVKSFCWLLQLMNGNTSKQDPIISRDSMWVVRRLMITWLHWLQGNWLLRWSS